MTEQEFINKWDNLSVGDWWNKDADRLFWARSYKMSENHLLMMSQDFLSVPRNENHHSSSLLLARRIVLLDGVK